MENFSNVKDASMPNKRQKLGNSEKHPIEKNEGYRKWFEAEYDEKFDETHDDHVKHERTYNLIVKNIKFKEWFETKFGETFDENHPDHIGYVNRNKRNADP